MKKILTILFLLMLYAPALAQQQVEYVTTTAPQELSNKTLDAPVLKGTVGIDPTAILRFGNALATAPNKIGPSLPTTCQVGDTFFLTTAVAGENIYGATSASPCTWTLQSGSGAAGGGDISAVGNCAAGNCFQAVTAGQVFAAPVGGGIAAFRALSDADIPNTITLDNLTQLTTRNYADLQNRTHVLATAVGLGPDHSITGGVAGYVLRVTGPTTAALAPILDADLPANLVRDTRTITAGTGLTGGGDLSVNRTLAILPDSTVQKLEIAKNGTLIGTRKQINLIEGANVTLTMADSAPNNRVDITVIAAAGGVGAGHTIMEEGVALPQRSRLNFIGRQTCVDNAGNDSTDCTDPAVAAAGISGDLQINTAGLLGASSGLNLTGGVLSAPALTINNALKLAGDVEPTTITADQNDYAGCNVAVNSVCRVSTNAARQITGFAGGSDGVTFFFYNQGANDVVLPNQSTLSAAVNRLNIGTSLVVTPGQGLIFQYDAVASRWRSPNTGGGGGGGAPIGATYLTQTSDAALGAEFALSTLATGILKNTTGTGVPTIAVQGTDYYAPGGTDVAVVDGGTGGSTAGVARTNLGVPGLADTNVYTSINRIGTTGILSILGSTSGEITIGRAAAAGTYNFNLPTSAGTSGQPLISGGGGAAMMSFGTLGLAGGGTGATSWTAARCVRVNSAGTALEVAGADCGAVGGAITGSGTVDKSAKFTAASVIGDSAWSSEDGTGMILAGNTRYGATGTNDYTTNFASITGNKVRNMRNVTGAEAVVCGTETVGDLVKLDANGCLVRAGKSERMFQFQLGEEDGPVLVDTNDQPGIFVNRWGQGITITEIWAESDAGSPIINLQRDDGSPANICSANLTVTTGGATCTIAGAEDNVAHGERIDLVVVTAGGTARRILVSVKYTMD